MIKSRLRSRVVNLGIANLSEYYDFIESKNGKDEIQNFISALTTNVSHFFRERHQFEMLENFLQSEKLPRPSIWSAGCSNGQEPYSISLCLSNMASHEAKILATDVDTEVLGYAKSATYTPEMMNGLTAMELKQLFVKVENSNEMRIRDDLRKSIVFKKLNLLHDWPFRRKFDVIFCRNVVIYFDSETRNSLWPRFAKNLNIGGLFFLGHSERVSEPEQYGFCPVGPNTYRLLSHC